jgi:cyclopropane-fatty-acyl-phospholipid synthase
MSPEAFYRDLLMKGGVAIDGGQPWDLQVRDPRAYTRMLRDGTIGFGEAFMEGWLDCARFDLLAERAFRADLSGRFEVRAAIVAWIRARLIPLGSRRRSFEIGELHYDAGNDFFEALLDPTMAYSCGYWQNAATLEAAQRAKLELICRKLELEPGMRVLDIGSGWGSFARFAAENYGVSVVGITVSRQQIEFAERFCAGLPATFRYLDYRDIDETFDRVVSVGMFEHVGRRYYPDFFAACARCVAPSGLVLLHTIGQQHEQPVNAWYDKYIAPGAEIPTIANVVTSAHPSLLLEDLHTFYGSNYDRTLMAWWANLDAGWDRLKQKYGEPFYRMWKLYLQGCAAGFRTDLLRVWQFVFSRDGYPGGYASVR